MGIIKEERNGFFYLSFEMRWMVLKALVLIGHLIENEHKFGFAHGWELLRIRSWWLPKQSMAYWILNPTSNVGVVKWFWDIIWCDMIILLEVKKVVEVEEYWDDPSTYPPRFLVDEEDYFDLRRLLRGSSMVNASYYTISLRSIW